jgi:hypothetical protein
MERSLPTLLANPNLAQRNVEIFDKKRCFRLPCHGKLIIHPRSPPIAKPASKIAIIATVFRFPYFVFNL